MEQGKFDEAIAVLQKHVAAKPDALDAHSLLRQLHWRKNDLPAHLAVTAKLCKLHLMSHNHEAAWQDYQEYTNAGGDRMPAATWLELYRIAEGQQNYDRAVTEYEHLAQAYLSRPSDALKFYQAAAASPVPHLDWESNIQGGIAESQKQLQAPPLQSSNPGFQS
jgi:tetratricopeptide (TPR) repeat protein